MDDCKLGGSSMKQAGCTLATDWLSLLFASREELRGRAEAAGWVVEDTTEPDPYYLAVLKPA